MEKMQAICTSVEWVKIWLPSLVSVVTLLINLGFYIFVQPKLGYKYKVKNHLRDVSDELFIYLANVVSLNDYNGVPTKVREYSLKIHLCFKDGTADEDITLQLEKIFQMLKKRKNMTDGNDIGRWNENFRDEIRVLRKQLGRYCGGL